jgi:hypothetical protein
MERVFGRFLLGHLLGRAVTSTYKEPLDNHTDVKGVVRVHVLIYRQIVVRDLTMTHQLILEIVIDHQTGHIDERWIIEYFHNELPGVH